MSVLNEKGMQNIWTKNSDLSIPSLGFSLNAFLCREDSDFEKHLESLSIFITFYSEDYFIVFTQAGLKNENTQTLSTGLGRTILWRWQVCP